MSRYLVYGAVLVAVLVLLFVARERVQTGRQRAWSCGYAQARCDYTSDRKTNCGAPVEQACK